MPNLRPRGTLRTSFIWCTARRTTSEVNRGPWNRPDRRRRQPLLRSATSCSCQTPPPPPIKPRTHWRQSWIQHGRLCWKLTVAETGDKSATKSSRIRSTWLPIRSTLLPVLATNRQQLKLQSTLSPTRSTLSPECWSYVLSTLSPVCTGLKTDKLSVPMPNCSCQTPPLPVRLTVIAA